jgi:hypothetical protein
MKAGITGFFPCLGRVLYRDARQNYIHNLQPGLQPSRQENSPGSVSEAVLDHQIKESSS